MAIFQTLQSTGIPCAYSHYLDKIAPNGPPYLVYIGDGQTVREADNTHYWRDNKYQIEYYFKEKNEENEATIEQALLDAGYLYEKSEDNYIESEDVFVIYYYV